jgi:glycosyltransferase involved in cell wall biosynthesis
MRIIHLLPGAGGGFYCENCIRDAVFLRQLYKLGHDAVALPMYLPAGAEHRDISKGPMFFGGVNVFLQQKFNFFRKTPRWLDSLLDSPKLLSKLAVNAKMTSARQLGETTLSMLQGMDGKQVKELERLLEWLILPGNKPDVVILSNALLLGLARPIREKLGCAVVSFLQDEDGFIDGLGNPWSQRVWGLMRQCAAHVDLFIAVSRYYQSFMAKKLALAPSKIQCLYLGLNLDDYEPVSNFPEIPTIGYLARMCVDNGLDILIEAVHILAGDERLQNIRVNICGGKTCDDEALLGRLQSQIRLWKLQNQIVFIDDFSVQSRSDFLRSISVMCVPFRKPAAYGLCVLEAMASGVGFVQPAAGVFPEYAQLSDAGMLYEPNSPERLAETLKPLLLDRQKMREQGLHGRRAMEQYFNLLTAGRQCAEMLEGVIRK